MASYRQIHTRMWSSDAWFIDLTPEMKLLFIYLFSNERASMCGLYEIPLKVISFETGLDRIRIELALEVFKKADKVEYDYDAGVIWVKNMMRYQCQTNPNEKVRARIQADIKAVPNCALKQEYINTLSVGYADGADTIVSSTSKSGTVSVSSEGGGVGEGDVFRAYEKNIGLLSPAISDALGDDIDMFGAEWVRTAIEYAARHEKRSQAYIRATLTGWKRDGLAKPPPNGSKPQTPAESKAAAAARQFLANEGIPTNG